jgi:hypothetical protein
MIRMELPSFAFNSVDVPGPKYRMWQQMTGKKGTSVAELAHEIDRVNRLAWQHKQCNLLNIIINCHGWDGGGGLSIGGQKQPSLTLQDASAFSFLKQKRVGTIWLVACQAAKGPAGKALCQELAIQSGYQVVAGDSDQDVGPWSSIRIWTAPQLHTIDEYEGTVYGFYAGGGMRVINPRRDIMTIME